jgi:hypothetical protein
MTSAREIIKQERLVELSLLARRIRRMLCSCFLFHPVDATASEVTERVLLCCDALSPLLAQSGHGLAHRTCPLSG